MTETYPHLRKVLEKLGPDDDKARDLLEFLIEYPSNQPQEPPK